VSDAPFALAFPNDAASLAGARRKVQEHLEACGVDETALHAVDLVLEELGGNVLRYGYDGASGRPIHVEVWTAPGIVRVALTDDARPFDPTRHPEPARASSLREARIGGHGISLVRKFARSMRYRRDGEKNRIEVEVARSAG
jgi:anti-sigma regulatory factor (Ser/Thr protein kinase)